MAQDVAILIQDVHGGHLHPVVRLDDDELLQACLFVGLNLVVDTFDDIFELDLTGHLRNDNSVEGIPLGNNLVLLHCIAVVLVERTAVGHVGRQQDNACGGVDEANFCQTAHNDLCRCSSLVDNVHGAQFLELEAGIVLGLDAGIGRCVACHTAGVERTERQLCTRLTDGLCCNDADCLALLHHAAGGKVAAVALHADTLAAFAREHRTNLDGLDGAVLNFLCLGLGNLLAGSTDELACKRMDDVMDRHATKDAVVEAADDFIAVLQGRANESAQGAAVLFVDDNVVADVNQTTGQVTGVGRLQCSIGQTLTGTVGRDEVLQHAHALLKVGEDGVLDGVRLGTGLLGLCHQTAHTGKLTDLSCTTTGTGVEHHVHGIEALVGLLHGLQQSLREVVVDMCPDIDDLIVTFLVCDEAHAVLAADALHFLVTLADELFLLFGDDDVAQVEGQTALVRQTIAEVLDAVQEFASAGYADSLDDIGDDAAQSLLGDDVVEEAYLDGNNLVGNDAAYRSLDHALANGAVLELVVYDNEDRSVYVDTLLIVGNDGFLGTVELQAAALCAGTQLGDVVQTEHHILRGNGDRSAVGRVQDVVRLEHQYLSLQDCLVAQRQMHGHLVAVEVGIERRTCQGMQLDGLALNHLGLEGLNAETVQRRGTVQQDRMSLHNVLENIPDHRLTAVNNLLCALHRLHNAAFDELADDERLVELCCHQLGNTALAHLQLGTDHDDGTG